MRLPPAARFALLAAVCALAVLLAGPDAERTSAADEQPATAADVLRAAGVEAGLCVRLGTTDGAFEVAAATGGKRVVHGLALDAKHAEAARRALRERGLYGPAAVERVASFERLPYADNLVNLLVANLDELGDQAPTDKESLRVLAPLGVAYLKRKGEWTKTVKPMPKGADEWTHFYHSPGGNPVSADEGVGPPTGLQWLAGSSATSAEPSTGYRLAGGRALYEWDPPSAGWKRGDGKALLICRDAFSGVFLWARESTVRPYKTRPIVMTADRVFLHLEKERPLVALDARDGKLVRTYDQGGKPGKPKRGGESDVNLVHHDGLLIQTAGDTVYVLDSRSGALKWQHTEAEGRFVDYPTVAADAGLVFFTAGKTPRDAGRYPGADARNVVACDLKTGQEKWRCAMGRELSQLTYVDGALYAFNLVGFIGRRRDLYLARLGPQDGKILWKVEPDVKGQLLDFVILKNKIYVMSLGLHVYDTETGKQLRTYPLPGNSRCDMSRASANYLLMSFGNFIDLATNPLELQRAEISRGSCGTGHTPGYGMLYYSPNRCQCFVSVRGYLATSRETFGAPLADDVRLEKGPAAGNDVKEPAAWPAAGEWPIYLGSPQRDSSTATAVPEKLQELWKAAVEAVPPKDAGSLATDLALTSHFNGPATAPVVAGGLVFVAVPEAHRVEARDAETGKKAWEFTAGGRVDTPPTIYGGSCLFGCRDGRVYSLDAATGKLRWRFLAAPYHRTMVAHNQPESTWPLFGSVAVMDKVLVVAAGRHPETNGGIFAYGLEPTTGKLLWKTPIGHVRKGGELGKKLPDAGVTTRPYGYNSNTVLNEILISDGKRAAMTGLVLDAKTGAIENAAWPKKPNDKPQPKPPYPMEVYLDLGFRPPYRDQALENYGGPGADHGSWLLRLKNPRLEVHGELIAFNKERVIVTRVAGVEWAMWDLTKELDEQGRGRVNSSAVPHWSVRGGHYKGLTVKAVVLAGDKVVLGLAGKPGEGELRVLSAKDGSELSRRALDTGVIQAGLASAGGRLYVSCADGSVRCFGE